LTYPAIFDRLKGWILRFAKNVKRPALSQIFIRVSHNVRHVPKSMLEEYAKAWAKANPEKYKQTLAKTKQKALGRTKARSRVHD
jgi:hypothetical protein